MKKKTSREYLLSFDYLNKRDKLLNKALDSFLKN